jgi:hypothetical protein
MDINFAFHVIEEVMEYQGVRRFIGYIIESIHKSLFIFPRPQNRKLVMEKVLANPTLSFSMLDFFFTSKIGYGNKRSNN